MANSNVWGWQEQIRVPCTMKCKKGVPSGNACYHSVQDISSFHLLPENMKVRIHRTVIFSVVFFPWVWNLVPHIKERRYPDGRNRLPRKIFGPKTVTVTVWRREKIAYLEFSWFVFLASYCWADHINRMRYSGHVAHLWGREMPTEMHAEFWLRKVKDRDHLIRKWFWKAYE